MALPDKDNGDPQLRWKNRYYDALAELEKKEKVWREIERLLRHLVTRLTLAADTRHPPLSKSLAELRNAVRDGRDIIALRNMIETISLQIGELDQIRSNRQSLKSPARILQILLKQLRVPESLARNYKDLDKQLNGLDEFSEVTKVIDQVAVLLNQMIEPDKRPATSPETVAEPRSKFLQRLFARQTEKPAAVPEKSDTEPREPESLDSPKTIAPAVGELLLQLALRLPDNVKNRINFRTLKKHINKARTRKDLLPIVEVIGQHIASAYATETAPATSIDPAAVNVIADAVRAFIAHLNPPNDLRLRVAELEKAFGENASQVDGLVHCLNMLADIVAEICKRLAVQHDELEGFFKQLTLRLQELEQGMQASGNISDTNHAQVLQMESEVRGEIGDIRTTMQAMLDLAQLKQTVDTRLDGLDSRIRQFREGEDARYQQAQELVKQLSGKVQVLEQDGEQLRQRLEQTQQEAMQDALTGLPNRKAYEEHIAAEVARSRRYGTPLSIVVWDVDKFKDINDTYGHAAGDRVLKVIGELLRDNIRQSDFVSRYGGEEFVLLLPQTPLEVARGVAEKLRAQIENTPFHFQEQRVIVTVSGGLAQYQNDEAVNQLFERADKAMYQAKQAGRNRIEVAGLPAAD